MILRNGATVLKKAGDLVLALWRGEFVMWSVDRNGEAYWGHYFKEDLDAALAAFNKKKGDGET